jgi:hypothetical protein
LLPNAIESVSLGKPTVLAFVDRVAQRGELRLILAFLAFQHSERRTYDFAGIFIPATLDFSEYEAFEFVRQIHIASGHNLPPLKICHR